MRPVSLETSPVAVIVSLVQSWTIFTKSDSSLLRLVSIKSSRSLFVLSHTVSLHNERMAYKQILPILRFVFQTLSNYTSPQCSDRQEPLITTYR
jgi:hypothetical protein